MIRYFAWRKNRSIQSSNEKNDSFSEEGNTYQCDLCGWVYDENLGDPDGGIPAGTRWEDIPETWKCPIC